MVALAGVWVGLDRPGLLATGVLPGLMVAYVLPAAPVTVGSRCARTDKLNGEVGPVFEPLRDPAFFAHASVDPELGTVVWPNGADLAPDTLHEQAARAA